jgi:hypothetical protein
MATLIPAGPRSSHTWTFQKPEPKPPRYIRALLWTLSVMLLAAGFYASWTRFLGDQNWLARSGGLVTFVAGWNVLTTGAWVKFLARQTELELRKLESTGPPVGLEEALARMISRKRTAMQVADLLLLGIGTLVWALGDLIQFWPRGALHT